MRLYLLLGLCLSVAYPAAAADPDLDDRPVGPAAAPSPAASPTELVPPAEAEVRALLDECGKLRFSGDAAAAERIAQKAVKVAPGSADAWAELGCCRVVRTAPPEGRRVDPKAFQYLNKAIELDPENGFAHRWLAAAYLGKDDEASAERHFQASIKYSPESFVAWHGLGMIRFRQKRYDDAVNLYQKAVALSPAYALLVARLAKALAFAGRKSEARTELSRARALRSDTDHERQDVDNAISETERALRLK